jgi:hypothetical protein
MYYKDKLMKPFLRGETVVLMRFGNERKNIYGSRNKLPTKSKAKDVNPEGEVEKISCVTIGCMTKLLLMFTI